MQVSGKVAHFAPYDRKLRCRRCSVTLDYNNAIYRHYNPFTGDELSYAWTLCESCSKLATTLGRESLRLCRDAKLFAEKLEEEWNSKTDK